MGENWAKLRSCWESPPRAQLIIETYLDGEFYMAGVPISAIVFSKTLTDADWQKKKGTIAKLKPTGLGAELKKAEVLHKAVNTDNLSPKNDNPQDKAALDKAVTKCKAYFKSTVEPLQKQLRVVETTAKKAEASLKKLPGAGDAAKAAAAIAKDADIFAITCKSLDLEAEIKDVADRIDRRNDLAANLLTDSIKKFLVGAKTYMSEQTAASWGKNVKQQGRSVSNSVKQLDAYNKKFWTEFEKFKGFDIGTLKLTEDSEDHKKKRLELTKAALAQVVEIAKFKP